MKNGFAFLYPPPLAVRASGGSLDVRSLCFPVEVLKPFDFLFSRFSVLGRGRGVQVIFQESSLKPWEGGGGPLADEYAVECLPDRIILSAATPRGRFFALSTLLQAVSFHAAAGCMPCFVLRDAPRIACRGFWLGAVPGGAPLASSLRSLLLDLALLKFSHCLLSPAAAACADLDDLANLAQRTGMELMFLDEAPGAVASAGPEPAGAGIPAEDWPAFFLEHCRQARAQKRRALVWGDFLLAHPEWIRRTPRDILVLNRTPDGERGGRVRAAVRPLQLHHVPQALCLDLGGAERLLPDAREGVDRVAAACASVHAEKLAGVFLSCSAAAEGCGLPAGGAMLLFQSASLLWSGRLPDPESFDRWALGGGEPDLFRVFSFLAQAEHRLPYTHLQYWLEDPLLAPCSRQGDPREVEAHFRKAALYLKKREIRAGEMAVLFAFVQRLYAFIAAKVEFSIRLQALLSTSAGGKSIVEMAARLRQGSLELKESYGLVRGRHFLPGVVHGIEAGWAGLERSLRQLAQAAASASGRAELLEELQKALNGDPLSSGAGNGEGHP